MKRISCYSANPQLAANGLPPKTVAHRRAVTAAGQYPHEFVLAQIRTTQGKEIPISFLLLLSFRRKKDE
jgi:hypothetical protein